MQMYIKNLEIWFNKWRLQLSAKKCSYNIYKKGNLPINIKNNTLSLKLFNCILNLDKKPLYLGANLDSQLNFKNHADIIKKKCLKSLNVLTNLSYKNWSLSIEEKLTVYKCLIRSKMEYTAPTLLMSKYFMQQMQGVQYRALKIILKKGYKTSSTYLHSTAKIETIEERFKKISINYLNNAILNKNPLILELTNNLIFSVGEHKTPIEKIRDLGTINSIGGI